MLPAAAILVAEGWPKTKGVERESAAVAVAPGAPDSACATFTAAATARPTAAAASFSGFGCLRGPRAASFAGDAGADGRGLATFRLTFLVGAPEPRVNGRLSLAPGKGDVPGRDAPASDATGLPCSLAAARAASRSTSSWKRSTSSGTISGSRPVFAIAWVASWTSLSTTASTMSCALRSLVSMTKLATDSRWATDSGWALPMRLRRALQAAAKAASGSPPGAPRGS